MALTPADPRDDIHAGDNPSHLPRILAYHDKIDPAAAQKGRRIYQLSLVADRDQALPRNGKDACDVHGVTMDRQACAMSGRPGNTCR